MKLPRTLSEFVVVLTLVLASTDISGFASDRANYQSRVTPLLALLFANGGRL